MILIDKKNIEFIDMKIILIKTLILRYVATTFLFLFCIQHIHYMSYTVPIFILPPSSSTASSVTTPTTTLLILLQCILHRPLLPPPTSLPP